VDPLLSEPVPETPEEVCVEFAFVSVDWLDEVDGSVEVELEEEGVVDCEPVDCVVVVLLVDDCELGELDVLCAATQTADSSRIAVIRYAFLICSSYTFGQQIAAAH
jgi:hypothetical protein